MPDPAQNRLALFFSAVLLSAFGYEFVFFVMTVHVYELSGSASSVAMFTTLTFAPRLSSSLLGGIADRFGRSRCLALAATALVPLLILLSRTSEMTEIYAIWFAASVFLTLIVNARSALQAEIVGHQHYAASNALSLVLLNGAKLAAPLLAGYASMHVDSTRLLHFASLVYLLTAIAATWIRAPGHAAHGDRGFIRNAVSGLRFMREHPVFGRLAAIAFFWRLFLGLQLSLLVVYVKDALHGSNAQYGVFAALIGVGSLAGSCLGPIVARKVKAVPLIRYGLSAHYAAFVLLGLCTHFAAALAIVFVAYLVFYATLVGLHAMRDRITHAQIRSSAYGTVTAILTPAAIASMLVGGQLAKRFGAPLVLALAGLLALASLHLILAPLKTSLQDA